jgi:hypothetical protein
MKHKHNILVEKHEGKIPFRRYMLRHDDNSKTELKDIGFEDVDWIKLTQVSDEWRSSCVHGNES